MSSAPPPPLPQQQPPPPRERTRSRKTLWIVLACLAGAALLAIPILLAILIPTVAKVRETAHLTVESSNLRMIVQGALIWAIEHGGTLPPAHLDPHGQPDGAAPATIHSVAAALAREGGLNDASVWFSAQDQARSRTDAANRGTVLDADGVSVSASFASEDVLAWDFATGLTFNLSPLTPVAWTRGLRTDGTWDPAGGVHGAKGGHVAFLGGNVQFFRDLRSTPLVRADGTTTSNILEALPASARVVGSGPGTLHGSRGLRPDRSAP